MSVTQRVPFWLLPHSADLGRGVRQLLGPGASEARRAVESLPIGAFWKANLSFDLATENAMKEVQEAWGVAQYVVWSAALWRVWRDPIAPTAAWAVPRDVSMRDLEEASVRGVQRLAELNERLGRGHTRAEKRDALVEAGLDWLFPGLFTDPPARSASLLWSSSLRAAAAAPPHEAGAEAMAPETYPELLARSA